MKTIHKNNHWDCIFINDNNTIKAMFNNWKIWLTKKEIANIYWAKKSDIKNELSSILKDNNLNSLNKRKKIYNEGKNKLTTYYSIDLLLLLWYKNKRFLETKYLINTNKIIKKYAQSRKHYSIIKS